jgi:hypothetical protein
LHHVPVACCLCQRPDLRSAFPNCAGTLPVANAGSGTADTEPTRERPQIGEARRARPASVAAPASGGHSARRRYRVLTYWKLESTYTVTGVPSALVMCAS